MKVRNVNRKEMVRALRIANKGFEGNLTFAHLDEGRFTLGVRDTEGLGGRLGSRKKDGTRRRVPHRACWHAHGRFFEALFGVQKKAVIESKVGGKIEGPTKADGNWQDHPIVGEKDAWYSQLCECHAVLTPARPRRRPKRIARAMRPEGLLGEVVS